MASPQNGTACSADPPESPLDAANADASQAGSTTEAQASPGEEENQAPGEDENPQDEDTHMIAIKLEDHEGKPVMHARYNITLPDGTESGGCLDKDGRAKLEPIPGGQCEICFPDIHQDEWSLKG